MPDKLSLLLIIVAHEGDFTTDSTYIKLQYNWKETIFFLE